MLLLFYQVCAYLLIGEKFDSGVGKDAKQCCGVAAEETKRAVLEVDVADCLRGASPGTSVLLKLRIGRLEKDLDAVEGSDYSFCLQGLSIPGLEGGHHGAYSATREPACDTALDYVFPTSLIEFPPLGMLLGDDTLVVGGAYCWLPL